VSDPWLQVLTLAVGLSQRDRWSRSSALSKRGRVAPRSTTLLGGAPARTGVLELHPNRRRSALRRTGRRGVRTELDRGGERVPQGCIVPQESAADESVEPRDRVFAVTPEQVLGNVVRGEHPARSLSPLGLGKNPVRGSELGDGRNAGLRSRKRAKTAHLRWPRNRSLRKVCALLTSTQSGGALTSTQSGGAPIARLAGRRRFHFVLEPRRSLCLRAPVRRASRRSSQWRERGIRLAASGFESNRPLVCSGGVQGQELSRGLPNCDGLDPGPLRVPRGSGLNRSSLRVKETERWPES
jgi:hypothetical protein